MNKENYVDRSFMAVSSAIQILSKEYNNICIPLKPNYFFDLIIEKNSILFKVKVIFTDCKQKSGSYVANIRKSGGYLNKKELKLNFKKSFCDYLFVVTPISCYFIPTDKVEAQRSLTLNKYEKYIAQ